MAGAAWRRLLRPGGRQSRVAAGALSWGCNSRRLLRRLWFSLGTLAAGLGGASLQRAAAVAKGEGGAPRERLDEVDVLAQLLAAAKLGVAAAAVAQVHVSD